MDGSIQMVVVVQPLERLRHGVRPHVLDAGPTAVWASEIRSHGHNVFGCSRARTPPRSVRGGRSSRVEIPAVAKRRPDGYYVRALVVPERIGNNN